MPPWADAQVGHDPIAVQAWALCTTPVLFGQSLNTGLQVVDGGLEVAELKSRIDAWWADRA